MISSKYTIREQNEAQILNQIIKHREISRAELSKITSLNKASVSSITNKLINDGFIIKKDRRSYKSRKKTYHADL